MRNLSWPAVSQICNFTTYSSSIMVLIFYLTKLLAVVTYKVYTNRVEKVLVKGIFLISKNHWLHNRNLEIYFIQIGTHILHEACSLFHSFNQRSLKNSNFSFRKKLDCTILTICERSLTLVRSWCQNIFHGMCVLTAYRRSRQDLPTPLFPISRSLNK